MRLQPEELLEAGLGRLPLRNALARGAEGLARILVHVVGVARRLGGCEERERVGCRGRGGEEAVRGGVGGEGHLRRCSEGGSRCDASEEVSECGEVAVELAGDGDMASNVPLIYTNQNVADC